MRPPLQFRPRPVDCEWLGGRYPAPNQSKPAEVDLWLELPRGVIVAITLIDPRNPIPFGASLQQTMKRPAEGPPRRPARIRVAGEALAREVREAAGNDVSVVVAPVPELDSAFEELVEELADDDPQPSYLGDGIEPEVVAALFSNAGAFFRAAPWKYVDETQVVQVDIPALDVAEACLCIIGGAGESFGLLLFRSFADYNATVAPMLSLSFSRKNEIPRPMIEEIARHGWKVAGLKAYPHVMAIDAEEVRPMTDRDLRILTACAGAFVAFFSHQRALFAADDPGVVCESFTGEDGVVVTLTRGSILNDTTNDDLIRQMKEAHYRKWLDTPLPILGGKTPRAAARSAKSRKALEETLRLIEDLERGQPPKERFDFGPLRRELGLDE